jgi:hypothetical protein
MHGSMYRRKLLVIFRPGSARAVLEKGLPFRQPD